MQRQTIPFVGQQATARSVQVNAQETLNLVTSIKDPGAKQRVVLESAEGLVQAAQEIGNGACRTSRFVRWRVPGEAQIDTYAVFGLQLVRLSAVTGVTVVGTLDDFATRCVIARGRTHLMVVDGRFGYTWDGTSFAKIADLDFPDADSDPVANPTHVVYQDGFFIVNDALSDNWYISDPEDPDSWNALEFEAAAVAPDFALALANTESELWVFGEETCQAYYNAGSADFPYRIILGATQEVGVAAPDSVAETDAGIFFIGTTPEGGRFVYRIQGQSGQIISGEEQETVLDGVDDIAAAYGFIFQIAGKSFYCMQLAPDQPTLVYNIRAGAWETRATVDGSAWRVGGAGLFGDRVIGGSRLGANYYTFSREVFDDAGGVLLRRRRSQIIHLNNQLMDWWEIVVDCQSGVGTASGDSADPQLRLRYSDDGGRTWSAQLFQPLGKIGERERRAVYRQLGQSRNRIYEVELAEPVELTIIAAYAVVTVLDD